MTLRLLVLSLGSYTGTLAEIVNIQIKEGKPIENAYDESFIGRLRGECLNTNRVMNLKHARDVIEDWHRDYNEVRPHSSLKGSTPQGVCLNDGWALNSGAANYMLRSRLT